MKQSASHSESGTVLLSTLLVLSLMSAVALGLLATVRTTVRSAQDTAETAQADLFADGARDFARAQVARLGTLEPEAANLALLSGQPIVLPFDGGSIVARVRDGTHCVRLSALTTAAGEGDSNEELRFKGLLEAVGVPVTDAARLATSAVDYADADSDQRPNGGEDGVYLYRDPPHRTANVPFSSIWELRAVDGMSEAVFQSVRPFVCMGRPGQPSEINIDTAGPQHLPVLEAALWAEDDPASAARRVLENRPAGGYRSEAALRAVLRPDTSAASADTAPEVEPGDDGAEAQGVPGFVFAPALVEVETVTQFGAAERVRVFTFALTGRGEPALVHRDWGRAALRPELTVPDQERSR